MIDLTKTVRIAPRQTSAGTEILDLATVRGELETKLLDLGDAAALQAHLRELCAQAAESAETAPACHEAVPERHEAVPERREPGPEHPEPAAERLEPTPDHHAPTLDLTQTVVIVPGAAGLDRTIYDGGALRDYARTLAESPSPSEEEVDRAPITPVAAEFKASVASSQRSAIARERWGAARTRWHTARKRWRTLRASRKLVLALLPLALILSAAGTIATLARRTPPSMAEPSPTRAAADRAARPPNRPLPSSPARPLPSSPARPQPSPVSPARVEASLPTPAANEPPHGAESVPPTADPVLERAALRAAFDGNKREAIAAYERLAARPGGEPFKLAARLLREDRVRKP